MMARPATLYHWPWSPGLFIGEGAKEQGDAEPEHSVWRQAVLGKFPGFHMQAQSHRGFRLSMQSHRQRGERHIRTVNMESSGDRSDRVTFGTPARFPAEADQIAAALGVGVDVLAGTAFEAYLDGVWEDRLTDLDKPDE